MNDWIKPFPVMCVYRFDLYRISLTKEQVNALTDEDMLTIANIVRIKYLEGGFYSHLLAAVEQVMQEKEAKQQWNS